MGSNISDKKRREIETSLLVWIRKESDSSVEISVNSDLQKERILDSIQFMTLILYIEELLEEMIPEEKILMENFTTVETIYNNFFQP